MYKIVKANNMTVGELIKILQTVPQNNIVSAGGVSKNMFINIDDNFVTFDDEYDLNAYEGLSVTIYNNSNAIGEVFADSQKDDTYSFYCFEDKHEESYFENYDEAVSTLLYYLS